MNGLAYLLSFLLCSQYLLSTAAFLSKPLSGTYRHSLPLNYKNEGSTTEHTKPFVYNKNGSILPPPPPPPKELMTISLDAKKPLLSKAALFTSSLVAAAIGLHGLDHTIAESVVDAVAGFAILPCAVYQHDIMHMHKNQVTKEHELVSLVCTLLTGTAWGEGPNLIHRNHHAITGDFRGIQIPTNEDGSTDSSSIVSITKQSGDQDDLWVFARNGNPFLKETTGSSNVITDTFAGVSAIAAIALFQPVMLFQTLRDSIKHKQFDVLLMAVLHMITLFSLLGPLGYMFFSLGMSAAFTLPAIPFHDPKGQAKDGDYFYNAIKNTRNLDHHDNPLVKYLLNGVDYHLEHHLWQDVPTENLHLLEPLAREYCVSNGMEYQNISWSDGLKESWQEGLALSRKKFDKE